MRMNATIKDVANRAGVSISTASLVINRKQGVSDKLRRKVWEAIEELNYHPNALARGLKVNASKFLGLTIPDIVNPFFPLIVRGVEDAAAHYGYTIILGNTDGEIEKEERYLNHFIEKRVDGLILIPSSGNPTSTSVFYQSALPKVIIDRGLTGMDIPTVITDNVYGAYLGTKHLLNNGRIKVLFISGPENVQASKDRCLGYSKALEEYKNKNKLIVYGQFSFESGNKIVAKALTELDFDAVLSANDMMALGAMKALAQKGVAIPEEIEVVGYDNILFSELSRPSLTTIEQPAYEMGFKAVELLVESINSDTKSVSKILEPRLIIRESSPKRAV